MNNNIVFEISVKDDCTQRCLGMLDKLIRTQEEILAFLASEGLDDSQEGEAIAIHLSEAAKAFDGILPKGVYDEAINCKVV